MVAFSGFSLLFEVIKLIYTPKKKRYYAIYMAVSYLGVNVAFNSYNVIKTYNL